MPLPASLVFEDEKEEEEELPPSLAFEEAEPQPTGVTVLPLSAVTPKAEVEPKPWEMDPSTKWAVTHPIQAGKYLGEQVAAGAARGIASIPSQLQGVMVALQENITEKIDPGASLAPEIREDIRKRREHVEKVTTQPATMGEKFVQGLGQGAVSMAAAMGSHVFAGPAGPFFLFGALQAGDIYEEHRAAGGTPEQSARSAITAGLVEGGLEAASTYLQLDTILAGSGGRLRKVATNALIEGLAEEGSQTLGEEAVRRWMIGIKRDAKEILSDLGMAIGIGAVLGGGMAGVASQPMLNQQLDSIINDMGIDPVSDVGQGMKQRLLQRSLQATEAVRPQVEQDVQAVQQLPPSVEMEEPAPSAEPPVPVEPAPAVAPPQVAPEAVEAVPSPAPPQPPVAEGAREVTPAPSELIPPNATVAATQAKKLPNGKWQLFWRGTRNEIFPNETFRSAQEAKMAFRAAQAKQRANLAPPPAKPPAPLPSPAAVTPAAPEAEATPAETAEEIGAWFDEMGKQNRFEREATNIEREQIKTEYEEYERMASGEKRTGRPLMAAIAKMGVLSAEQVKRTTGLKPKDFPQALRALIRHEKQRPRRGIYQGYREDILDLALLAESAFLPGGELYEIGKQYKIDPDVDLESQLLEVLADEAEQPGRIPSIAAMMRRAPSVKKLLGIKEQEPIINAAQALKYALKKAQTASANAYLAGAREQVQTTKQLMARAKTQLPPHELLKISKAIASARTPAQIQHASDAIEILAERGARRQALNEFRTVRKTLDLKRMRPEYKERAQTLLESITDRTRSAGLVAKMKKLMEYLEVSDDPNVPNPIIQRAKTVLAENAATPLRKLDSDTIRAITKTIQHIKHLADRKSYLLHGKKKRRIDKMQEQAPKDVYNRRGGGGKITAEEAAEDKRFQNAVVAIASSKQMNLETIAHVLGGRDSEVYRVFATALREGREEMLSLQRDILRPLRAVYEEQGIKPGWDEEKVTLELSHKRKLELTRGELVTMLAHMTDPSTRKQLLLKDAEGITLRRHKLAEATKLFPEDLALIEDQAGEKEKAVRDKMMRLINGPMRDAINKWWLDTYGFEIAESRFHWSRTRDQEFHEREPNKAMRDWQSHLVDMGIWKPRSTSTAPIVVDNAFTEFFLHLLRTSATIGKTNAVQDALRLTEGEGGRAFRNAVRRTTRYGDSMLADIKRAVADYEALDSPPKGAVEDWSRAILRNMQRGVLGLRPHIMLYQGVSYMNVLSETDRRDWLKGMKGAFDSSLDEEMTANSGDLWARYEGGSHAILSPGMAAANKSQFHFGKKGMKKLDVFLSGIHDVDWRVMRMIWTAVKAEGGRKGLKGQGLLDYTARRSSEIIDRTQPTWDALTTSMLGLDAKKSTLAKMATLFSSQRSKNLNMAIRAVSDFRYGTKDAAAMRRLALEAGIPVFVQSLMVEVIRRLTFAAYRGFKDKPEILDVAWGVMRRIFGNWLILGDLVADLGETVVQAASGKPPEMIWEKQNPISKFLDDAMKSAQYIAYATQKEVKGKDAQKQWGKAIEHGADLMSTLFGLSPLSSGLQIGRPYLPWRQKKEVATFE